MQRYRRVLDRLRAEREPDAPSRDRLRGRLRALKMTDEAWSQALLSEHRAAVAPEDEALARVEARFERGVKARRAGAAPVMSRTERDEPYTDDTVFLGFLTLSHVAAAFLVMVILNAEPAQTKGLMEIPDRFTELILDKPDLDKPDVESEEPEIDENLEGPEVVKKETESSDAVADLAPAEQTPEQQEVAEAQRQEQAREEVIQESSLLMALLGTTGDANNGDRVQDLFSEDDWGGQNLDAALANVSGAEVATTNEVGVREAQGGGEGSADIGDLAKANTGGAGVGSGPTTTVEGIVSGGTADIIGAANDAGVRGVIQRYRGQIKYCYDAQLKKNPTLQGRVDIMFTIARGRVLTTSVLANSTGDAALGDCIARKVQGWRFDSDEEAEVVYPFILAL